MLEIGEVLFALNPLGLLNILDACMLQAVDEECADIENVTCVLDGLEAQIGLPLLEEKAILRRNSAQRQLRRSDMLLDVL